MIQLPNNVFFFTLTIFGEETVIKADFYSPVAVCLCSNSEGDKWKKLKVAGNRFQYFSRLRV